MKLLKLALLVPLLVLALPIMAQTTFSVQSGINCGVAVPATPDYACSLNILAPIYHNWGAVYFQVGGTYAQEVKFTYAGPNSMNGTMAVTGSSIQVIQPYTPYHNSPNSYILTVSFAGTDSVTGSNVSGIATLPFEYEYLSSGGRGGHSANYTIGEGGSVTIN